MRRITEGPMIPAFMPDPSGVESSPQSPALSRQIMAAKNFAEYR
jgi:hypothetical protein